MKQPGYPSNYRQPQPSSAAGYPPGYGMPGAGAGPPGHMAMSSAGGGAMASMGARMPHGSQNMPPGMAPPGMGPRPAAPEQGPGGEPMQGKGMAGPGQPPDKDPYSLQQQQMAGHHGRQGQQHPG